MMKESSFSFLKFLTYAESPSQSAPTILVLKTWVGVCDPEKNWVQTMECKKYGHCCSKEKRPVCLFSFWITMTLFFCTLLFSGPYFGPDFFQGHKPTHVFKTRIVGADWLGDCRTELFPIYQNKHWTIRRQDEQTVVPLSHRIILKIVGF